MEMTHMLLDLLEAPDACTLEKFFGRIPMVFILDQVPALEREMLKRIKEQGIDIVPRILIVTRLLPDAVEAPVGNILRKYLEQRTVISCEFPLETKTEFFVNGSLILMYGHTSRLSPRMWPKKLQQSCKQNQN
ncbi:hypothetical protein L6452_27949 [Arctium lappa]|uniref:Uncharacterized protein n=1 Tax=Arctium lappa TaxID=4217 RepID=A0ACB8ZY40_ARCLA|nr:hypothetical protein L6452_27949 [Arctium lappa]